VVVEQLSQATAVFAVTNVDDLVLLALFFARAGSRRAAVWRVVGGQYLGFAAILAVSVVGALGVGLLPEPVVAYLGLVPLLLGIRAAWRARPEAADDPDPDPDPDTDPTDADAGPTVPAVAAVTFANGGDNIGVYVPVLSTAGANGTVTYVVVFLVLTGLWCLAGRVLATRRPVARALARQGHLVLPVVLIALGIVILVQGGAFGL
jgi:cadmium resistance protein CadD (predicted permease)